MSVDETTATLPQEKYDKLVEERRRNKAARGPALEEARLWCQVHKGTDTLAEGLRVCTPAELRRLYWDYGYVGVWSTAADLCVELERRLRIREEAARRQREALAAMERAPLEEVETDG